jgi:hypothetical protein
MLHRVLQTVPPSGWLVVDEIGVIERDLRKLEEVVVILDKIERPYHLLLDAVLNNFSENVRYHFFVAERNFASSHEHFKPFFEQLIAVAATIRGSQIVANAQLCHIYKLPFRRQDDYPYIFYCYRNGVERPSGQRYPMHIIAFRGCDKGRGLADQYKRVEPAEARTTLETTFGTLLKYDNIELPKWIVQDQEYTNEETVKLLEFRPPVVIHGEEAQKIELISAPE